jgi:hypothetical protein
MSDLRWEILHKKKEETASLKLNNILQFPEYSLLEFVDQLKTMVETLPTTHRDWLPGATSLVQLSTGCRFVECFVVNFSVSTQDKFPGNIWIVQMGVVKDSSEVSRNFNRALRKH